MKFSKFFELKKELKRGSRFQKALVLIVVLVALPFTLYEVFQSAKYLSKALINPVSLSFLPSSVSLPPDGTLRLMMDAKTYKIGFVKVEIDFDNSKVNLASEVIPTTTLKKVISLTSLANANATGKIVAILGIDPNDVANAPTGAFELANFKITPVML
ncbi:hypothetical protein HYS03_00305 [Candidatus Woesebacteria bacterium]|nr:hypothetical protein [Candidatus Woesebacteria bacterium]